MFILQLNPMMGNFEQLNPVACSETVEALKAFIESQRVEPYTDDDGAGMIGQRLNKSFRKGGPLEFLNPPDRGECIVNVGTAEEWAQSARLRFAERVLSLPHV